jgi:hypothetical protein
MYCCDWMRFEVGLKASREELRGYAKTGAAPNFIPLAWLGLACTTYEYGSVKRYATFYWRH